MDEYTILRALINSAYLGAFCCFVLILLHKWGFAERYDIYRRKGMPAWCNFCVLWWLGCIKCLLWFFLLGAGWHIFLCLPVIPVFGLFLYKTW